MSAQQSPRGIAAAEGMAGAANSRKTPRSISTRASPFGRALIRVMPAFLDDWRVRESRLGT